MIILNQENLSEAVVALKEGQTIVFPTETSYGLGCDAANQEAVDKIFKIKQRRSDKPLLVVVPDVEMAKKYLVWNDLLEDLANKYWPGPLTVVGEYNKKETLAMGVVATDNTIAVRVTNFLLTKSLSQQLGSPLVATSANIADAGDVYGSQQVLAMFSAKEAKPDILVDGGQLPQNPPTTIVRVFNNPSTRSAGAAQYGASNLKILRQGQIQIN